MVSKLNYNGNGNGGGNGNNREAFLFYYHPDHLGSSSYLSDTNGEVYQHIEYFPFGETFLEEHSNTNRTPYLFNGKELDEETGLYYYGARYYDARTSVWQSVDPIFEGHLDGIGNGGVYKPSHLNVYSYTLNNPINYIDPDGNIEREDDYEGKMNDGDWYKSDRLNNTDRWKAANRYNLSKGAKGAQEYTTISQRTDFYGWYQGDISEMGHETQWAGAAYVISGLMKELDTWKSSFISDEVIAFGNEGNKAIFDDVFDDLGQVYFSNKKITGAQAEFWDMKTLYKEQFIVIEPIYKKQSEETLKTLSKMAKGQGIYRFGVPSELRFEGNINSPMDRFNHGWTKATNYYLKNFSKKK